MCALQLLCLASLPVLESKATQHSSPRSSARKPRTSRAVSFEVASSSGFQVRHLSRWSGHLLTVAINQAYTHPKSGALVETTLPCTWLRPCVGAVPQHNVCNPNARQGNAQHLVHLRRSVLHHTRAH